MYMKPFRNVITPHQDVLESQTIVAKYAADLWRVHIGEAPAEYGDASRFFEMTYMTGNMRQILSDIEEKLKHGEGDAFKQIETPFGGGKTHTMIAAYHKAKELGVKTVVIDGMRLSAYDTLWGIIEEQLDGKIDAMSGYTSPRTGDLEKLLQRNEPVLILIDELLAYMVTADGRQVAKTTLGDQTKIFIQKLSTAVSKLERVCVISTFLSSGDEYMVHKKTQANVDDLIRVVKKISGRQDHKITPVSPNDVPNVIRRRLFVTPERELEEGAKRTVDEYVEFCKQNDLLPQDVTEKQYAEKFMRSYPFLPDVIEVLYEKWGTFSSFQRTRGVLRLLAMVVHRIKDSGKPYITLADFDLNDDIIRGEIVGHLDRATESALSHDITKSGSGASTVTHGVPCATVMFMNSFDRDGGEGATVADIKRAVASSEVLPANIGDAIVQLQRKLYYMDKVGEKFKFSSKPNANKIKNDMDVSEEELLDAQRAAIKDNCGNALKTYVWPSSSLEVPDDEELKLVILNVDDKETARKFMWMRGENKRSNINSVLVLYPSNTWHGLRSILRESIAIRKVLGKYKDLPPNNIKEFKETLAKNYSDIPCNLLNTYSKMYLPGKDGPQQMSLSIVTVSSGRLDETVYDTLKGEEIHEELDPLILKRAYLSSNKFTHTENMFGSMMRDPGSRRPINEDVVERAIVNGVERGEFGLGTVTDTEIRCDYYNETPSVSFATSEVLIKDPIIIQEPDCEPDEAGENRGGSKRPPMRPEPPKSTVNGIRTELTVRLGRVSEFSDLLNDLLDNDFKIKITLDCTEGNIEDNKYQKIKDQIDDIDRSAQIYDA